MQGNPRYAFPPTTPPLDYAPVEDPIPDRPSRLQGLAINVACVIGGLLIGLLF